MESLASATLTGGTLSSTVPADIRRSLVADLSGGLMYFSGGATRLRRTIVGTDSCDSSGLGCTGCCERAMFTLVRRLETINSTVRARATSRC